MMVSPNETANGTGAPPASELAAGRWSVLTFDGCAASNLSYDEAARLVAEMSDITHGLCIVTDAAAEKIRKASETKQKRKEGSEDLSQTAFQEML